MKTLGFIMLHYGADYFRYSVETLLNVCDKVIVLYSRTPTHQQGGYLLCPDTLESLYFKHPKLEWLDIVGAKNEADHMNNIFNYTKGYDVLVRADADEVWDESDLVKSIKFAYDNDFRQYGINGFINFWRSFNHIVSGCEFNGTKYDQCDFFRPIRLWNLHATFGEGVCDAKIYHFGYAINDQMMRYKLSIHGHKDEISNEWYQLWENWKGEKNGYFHPASMDVWHNIIDFDKNTLPDILKEHKYYNHVGTI